MRGHCNCIRKGVLSLASSRETSNGPDMRDTAQALNSFEESNNVRIIVTIRSCGLSDGGNMWYEAKAITRPSAGVVPALLASVQLSCGALNIKTMDAAIMNLLYQLDFELAAKEWASVKQKSE